MLRRSFLGTMLATVAAPAIVKACNIMPVRPVYNAGQAAWSWIGVDPAYGDDVTLMCEYVPSWDEYRLVASRVIESGVQVNASINVPSYVAFNEMPYAPKRSSRSEHLIETRRGELLESLHRYERTQRAMKALDINYRSALNYVTKFPKAFA